MMAEPSWTIAEAVDHLHPPVKPRDLARLLRHAGVPPVGRVYGRLGRRPYLYPITEIMRVHAAWAKAQGGYPSDGR
jgi:hypothetical protein